MQTERVTIATNGNQANNWNDSEYPLPINTISSDGRYVAFISTADNLVAEDTNGVEDIFIRDLKTGKTTRASVATNGKQSNNSSTTPAISADGRYVAFDSEADNLVSGDTNFSSDVFVYDRKTGKTSRVSLGNKDNQGNNSSFSPAISADGRYVAFHSYADNLVGGDDNQEWDVFVRDRKTDKTTRVSVASDGTEGNGMSSIPAISGDGRYVAFNSKADNLVPGDTNGIQDIFIHDLKTGKTTRTSIAADGTESNDASWFPALNEDGRYVAFESSADNLVPGDTNYVPDVLVYDTKTETITRASVDSNDIEGNNSSTRATLSADGRYVAFSSYANNLVPEDNNGLDLVDIFLGIGTDEGQDIFVRDLVTGETIRASVASDGTETNNISNWPAISADGNYVSFVSAADNLVPEDTNGIPDIFVHDRGLTPEPTNTGSEGDDTLIGSSGKDILKGGKGNDTYQLDAKTASGSRIIDTQGNDVLELDKANISLDGLAKGKRGITSKGKDLIIDINADGKAKGKQDLTVKNFFANKKANKPGKGFIETVDNVTGEEIIDALNDSSNGGIVKKGNNKKNTLKGKGKDDNLDGQGGSDKLLGNGGSDILTGGNGNDTLNGGSGDDTLTGGKGRDSFAFTTKGKYSQEAMGEDTITDFIVGQDKLSLDSDTFARLKPNQDFSKQFATVTRDKAAATSDAYIVYNSNNGHLFYNANGDKPGMGAGGQFATLDGAPELDANDFNLV